jgi:hypothetical protein
VLISSQAQYRSKVHWCKGQFTNYRVFESAIKIIPTRSTSSAANKAVE